MTDLHAFDDLVADDLLLDRLGARAGAGAGAEPVAQVLGALAAHADVPLAGTSRGRRRHRHRYLGAFAALAVAASGAGVAAAVTQPDRTPSRSDHARMLTDLEGVASGSRSAAPSLLLSRLGIPSTTGTTTAEGLVLARRPDGRIVLLPPGEAAAARVAVAEAHGRLPDERDLVLAGLPARPDPARGQGGRGDLSGTLVPGGPGQRGTGADGQGTKGTKGTKDGKDARGARDGKGPAGPGSDARKPEATGTPTPTETPTSTGSSLRTLGPTPQDPPSVGTGDTERSVSTTTTGGDRPARPGASRSRTPHGVGRAAARGPASPAPAASSAQDTLPGEGSPVTTDPTRSTSGPGNATGRTRTGQGPDGRTAPGTGGVAAGRTGSAPTVTVDDGATLVHDAATAVVDAARRAASRTR